MKSASKLPRPSSKRVYSTILKRDVQYVKPKSSTERPSSTKIEHEPISDNVQDVNDNQELEQKTEAAQPKQAWTNIKEESQVPDINPKLVVVNDNDIDETSKTASVPSESNPIAMKKSADPDPVKKRCMIRVFCSLCVLLVMTLGLLALLSQFKTSSKGQDFGLQSSQKSFYRNYPITYHFTAFFCESNIIFYF